VIRATSSWTAAAVFLALIPQADAQPRYADVLGLYDPGDNVGTVDIGFGGTVFDNPDAALGGPGATVELSGGRGPASFVSLGGYTGGEGLIVGFSTPVANVAGTDLLIQGNNTFGLHEPGFVEVAVESDGGGATADGWADETFYLLRPANFGSVIDPRTGPNPIAYATQTPGAFDFVFGDGAFKDPAGLEGYFDVALSSPDGFDLNWAIDAADQPVPLTEVAYVRLRTVTDSSIDYTSINFGTEAEPHFLGTDYFSSEVDWVAAVPEPSLAAGGLLAVFAIGRRRRSC